MKLDRYLKSVGKTPEQFALQIQTSGQTVRRYIDGTRIPRLRVEMPRIIEATGGKVTANDFLPELRRPEPRKKIGAKKQPRPNGGAMRAAHA